MTLDEAEKALVQAEIREGELKEELRRIRQDMSRVIDGLVPVKCTIENLQESIRRMKMQDPSRNQ